MGNNLKPPSSLPCPTHRQCPEHPLHQSYFLADASEGGGGLCCLHCSGGTSPSDL